MKDNQIFIRNTFKHILFTHTLLNITSYLCSIIGGYIAGNFLDSIALAASSFISPYSYFTTGLAIIFSSAGEILCGKAMGLGDKKRINKSFTNIIFDALAISMIVTVVSLLFSSQIVSLLANKSDLITYNATVEYFRAYAIGIPAYILMPVISSYLYMENESKYVLVSVTLLAALYAIFGISFTLLLNLSYFGFGLAETLSQIIVLLFLVARIIKNKKQINFDLSTYSFSFITTILKLGFAAGSIKILVGFRNIYLNKVLATSGVELAISGKSVLHSSVCLVDCISNSFTEAAVIIASICIGERNRKDLLYLYKYALTTGLVFFGAILLVYILGAYYISSIFTKDIALRILSTKYLRLYLISSIFEIVANLLLKIYIIFKYDRFVNIITIFHGVILHTVFTFLTRYTLKDLSVFLGYTFTEVVTIIAILFFIIKNKKHFPKSIEDILLVRNDFDDVKKMNIAIDEYSQISNVSKQISDFCLNTDINRRTSMLAGLCAEEMISNIYEHGYTKTNKKNHHVDIFTIIENNEVVLRIRDNAYPFDPTSRELIFDSEDPCKNAGLKIVKNTASEFTYQNIFGLNNTIIKLNNN